MLTYTQNHFHRQFQLDIGGQSMPVSWFAYFSALQKTSSEYKETLSTDKHHQKSILVA
jgi:hypothetical protein